MFIWPKDIWQHSGLSTIYCSYYCNTRLSIVSLKKKSPFWPLREYCHSSKWPNSSKLLFHVGLGLSQSWYVCSHKRAKWVMTHNSAQVLKYTHTIATRQNVQNSSLTKKCTKKYRSHFIRLCLTFSKTVDLTKPFMPLPHLSSRRHYSLFPHSLTIALVRIKSTFTAGSRQKVEEQQHK